MFSLWRKLELAESVYFRPFASFSPNGLSTFRQTEVVKKDASAVTGEPELLETTFKSATHPIQVLNTLPSNPAEFRTMPGETVIRALQTIAVLQRANKDTIKSDFITKHPTFEQLCRRLKRCSAMFTADELVNSFKFLCSLNVPTNSEISLTLLNLIRHEINNLSVDKIIYLDYVLNKAECRSELQHTIQKSLPIVFELQLPQQIDRANSVTELVSILNYLASHNGLDTKNDNIKSICKLLCDKQEQITAPDAINIIYHLCAIERFYLRNSIKLMTTSIRRLIDQITDVEMDEMQKVVNRLVSTTVNHFSPFQFSLHFLLKSCCERISQEDLGLATAISLQKTLKFISFQSPTLLKYMGDKIQADIESCRSMSSADVFTIVQAFANNCYLPETPDCDDVWSNRIVPAILANDNLAKLPTSSKTWFQFTLQLAILGYFDQNLISRVLSPSYLQNYLTKKELSILDLQKVLILYQTVAMKANIDLSGIEMDMISGICKRYKDQMPACDIQYDLIEHVGQSCVLTNVRTKYMHIIGTLVKVDKLTGHLEQFEDAIKRDEDGFISLEDVTCKDNEVLVCIDSVKRYNLFSNITHTTFMPGIRDVMEKSKIGIFRLRPKQLQQLGLSVCEINHRRYKTLRVGAKAKYLQESIVKHAQATVN